MTDIEPVQTNAFPKPVTLEDSHRSRHLLSVLVVPLIEYRPELLDETMGSLNAMLRPIFGQNKGVH